MAKYLTFLILIALFSGGSSGCATSPDVVADSRDPWQGFNRKVYSFNDALIGHF